jgi:hypothetical protein
VCVCVGVLATQTHTRALALLSNIYIISWWLFVDQTRSWVGADGRVDRCSWLWGSCFSSPPSAHSLTHSFTNNNDNKMMSADPERTVNITQHNQGKHLSLWLALNQLYSKTVFIQWTAAAGFNSRLASYYNVLHINRTFEKQHKREVDWTLEAKTCMIRLDFPTSNRWHQ